MNKAAKVTAKHKTVVKDGIRKELRSINLANGLVLGWIKISL
jgi:hypothetical protein